MCLILCLSIGSGDSSLHDRLDTAVGTCFQVSTVTADLSKQYVLHFTKWIPGLAGSTSMHSTLHGDYMKEVGWFGDVFV